MKRNFVFLLSFAFIFVADIFAEDITITTYYPAPYGVYQQLTTTDNTYLATLGGTVAIGTTNPDNTVKLDVQNGEIKATGGLIIETRNGSDPAPLADGQIWLRTDVP